MGDQDSRHGLVRCTLRGTSDALRRSFGINSGVPCSHQPRIRTEGTGSRGCNSYRLRFECGCELFGCGLGIIRLGGVVLLALINLENMVRKGKDAQRQSTRPGLTEIAVPHHQSGEGVGFQCAKQIQSTGPEEVVKPVSVLQSL